MYSFLCIDLSLLTPTCELRTTPDSVKLELFEQQRATMAEAFGIVRLRDIHLITADHGPAVKSLQCSRQNCSRAFGVHACHTSLITEQVSGGGSGIGLMIATGFVKNGGRVIIASRKETQLKEVRLPCCCSSRILRLDRHAMD